MLIQATGNALLLPALCGLSFFVTFALAFLSWHVIEKRALGMKNLGAGDLRRVFGLPEAVTGPEAARK